jgi:hypothetical protein
LCQVRLQHPLQFGASDVHRYADSRSPSRAVRQRGHAPETRPPGTSGAARPARGGRLADRLPRLRRIELHDRLGGISAM